MLEWIAVISMLIDHLGFTFFSEDKSWRIIGRLAFPIYTYLVVMGLNKTSSRIKYFIRLLILAALAQVPFTLLFDNYSLNVIFTLLIGASAVVLYERLNKIAGITILIFLGIIMTPGFTDYGVYGYALFLLYYFLKEVPVALLVGHAILDVLFSGYYAWSWYSIQSFSILATVIIILRNQLPNMKIPRLFYRSFYPAHLLFIYLLAKIIL